MQGLTSRNDMEKDIKIFFRELDELIGKENLMVYAPDFLISLTVYAERRLATLHKYLNSIPYKDFLKTTYWKIINAYIKRRDNGRCVQCNSSEDLVIHHRTYEHHGLEHLNTQDLYTFCNKCHNEYHENNDHILKEMVHLDI